MQRKGQMAIFVTKLNYKKSLELKQRLNSLATNCFNPFTPAVTPHPISMSRTRAGDVCEETCTLRWWAHGTT